MLRIWKGGCIIRAKILNFLREVIKEDPSNVSLLLSEKSQNFIKDKIDSVKRVSDIGRKCGIQLLCLNSSLDYFYALSSEYLPANLIQAQRDFFGAHTYERVDKEGIFHTEWEKLE